MKSLFAGIMTKITGSQLSTDVGGRIYAGSAPEGATYPYIIFMNVSSYPEDTFTEKVEEYQIQFSLFSTSSGITEIGTMYADLRSLFDDATFSISGDTLIRCMYNGSNSIPDYVTTTEGTVRLRHWAVEYIITVED